NTSFLTALTAVGYRPTDWLRIGVGFQWTMVAFTSYTYARPTPDLNVRNDIRTKADGKDLFIPGLIASVHVVPNDSLDIAAGFKWSDRVRGDTSLDLTAGSFGTGRAFTDSDGKTYGSTVPTTAKNQLGSVDSPPIWVPQLSFGVRYADRLVPRTTTKSWEAAHLATAPDVQDHMATERFDVEADAVVYFNSANDQSSFSNDAQKAAMLQIVPVDAMGNKLPAQQAHVGECTKWDAMHVKCLGQWKVPLVLGGKNQVSLRVGGDYNVLPDFFTVRAGMSYETNGINPEYFDVTTYMMGRTGLHAGFTLRLFDKTDFSFAFAHFIQKSIRLQINPKMQFSPRYYKNAMGVDDPAVGKMYNYVPGKHDGVAKWEAPYGNDFGPNFVNAGSYYYDLDVVSFALSQHF
ncbi:MAG TPA: hypothetical protein VHM19_18290, partial [Polyangiales bacterium]|nr:hypothetical protein [Polyangiales bacterium]